MTLVRLKSPNDFEEWRDYARTLCQSGIEPQNIQWTCNDAHMEFLTCADSFSSDVSQDVFVPRDFLDFAQLVICHSDPNRFTLLYRILWRLQTERALLKIASDQDIFKLNAFAKSVRRDCHKMKAFVRFNLISATEKQTYVAWFEPEHFTVERTAPFFVRRFSAMHFAIVTPYRTASWDCKSLTFSDGASKPTFNVSDNNEELWQTYYKNIFNPARLKIKAMQAEMPKKYWINLPEARVIPDLIKKASSHVATMTDAPATAPSQKSQKWKVEPQERSAPVSDISSLEEARQNSAHCKRCDLYCHATQTVFGAGNPEADILFVGEQPGDKEDLAGLPFVGPAGQLFDICLAEAGIDRKAVYITNAVKHFKYEPKGKLRLHRSPNKSEVDACRFWVNLERAFIKPKLIVTLGATAALSITGKPQKFLTTRGHFYKLEDETPLMMTIHPSFLLRLREGKAEQQKLFIEDLAKARLFAAKANHENLKLLAA